MCRFTPPLRFSSFAALHFSLSAFSDCRSFFCSPCLCTLSLATSRVRFSLSRQLCPVACLAFPIATSCPSPPGKDSSPRSQQCSFFFRQYCQRTFGLPFLLDFSCRFRSFFDRIRRHIPWWRLFASRLRSPYHETIQFQKRTSNAPSFSG